MFASGPSHLARFGGAEGMGAGALWEAEEAEGRQPLVRNALPVLSLLRAVEVGCSPPTWGSLLRKKGEWGAVGAGERPWCYPTSEDTRSPPLASSVLRKQAQSRK